MSKNTHVLKITSKEVIGAGWVEGTTVPLDKYDNAAEAISGGHFKDEASILAAAYGNRFVRVNRLFRDTIVDREAGSPVPTVEELRVAGNALTFGARAERVGGATSTTKKVLEEKVAKATAVLSTMKFSKEQRAELVAAGILPA